MLHKLRVRNINGKVLVYNKSRDALEIRYIGGTYTIGTNSSYLRII